MDINKITLAGSLSEDASRDLLTSQLVKLAMDFPEQLQEIMHDWIDGLVRELWDHTAGIPKADVRLKSLTMMLAKKVDKAGVLTKVLVKHELDGNQELFIDLLGSL